MECVGELRCLVLLDNHFPIKRLNKAGCLFCEFSSFFRLLRKKIKFCKKLTKPNSSKWKILLIRNFTFLVFRCCFLITSTSELFEKTDYCKLNHFLTSNLLIFSADFTKNDNRMDLQKRKLEKQIIDKLLSPKYYDKRVKPKCADHDGNILLK